MLAAAFLKLHFNSFLKQEHSMNAETLKQLLLKIKIEPGDESTVKKSIPKKEKEEEREEEEVRNDEDDD